MSRSYAFALSMALLGLAMITAASLNERREQNAGLPLVHSAARIGAPTVIAPCPIAPRNFQRITERRA
jgi:hypothetical protein